VYPLNPTVTVLPASAATAARVHTNVRCDPVTKFAADDHPPDGAVTATDVTFTDTTNTNASPACTDDGTTNRAWVVFPTNCATARNPTDDGTGPPPPSTTVTACDTVALAPAPSVTVNDTE
jgi:hypothetical protein